MKTAFIVFFLDLILEIHLSKRSVSKSCQIATTIRKRLGFDLNKIKFLCEQFRKYKDQGEPFDLDIDCYSEDPKVGGISLTHSSKKACMERLSNN